MNPRTIGAAGMALEEILKPACLGSANRSIAGAWRLSFRLSDGVCVQHGAATITFFDRTYEEAFCLLEEARDYLADRQRREAEALAPGVQLMASCETMRLTTRLVQIMAWLLVQRAVHAGEIDAEEADRPERRLGGGEICVGPAPWDATGLPRRLQVLLDRSQALYTRVARLDEMVHIRASQQRELSGAGESGYEGSGNVPV